MQRRAAATTSRSRLQTLSKQLEEDDQDSDSIESSEASARPSESEDTSDMSGIVASEELLNERDPDLIDDFDESEKEAVFVDPITGEDDPVDAGEDDDEEEIPKPASRRGKSKAQIAEDNAASDDEDALIANTRVGEDPRPDDAINTIDDVKKVAHKLTAKKVVATNFQPGAVARKVDVDVDAVAVTTTKKKPRSILSTQEKKAVQYEISAAIPSIGVPAATIDEMKKKYSNAIATNNIPNVAELRKDYALLHRNSATEYKSFSVAKMREMLFADLGITPPPKKTRAKK